MADRQEQEELYVPVNVTTGELYRLILTIKKDLREKPSNEQVNNLKERIIDLESWQTWAMRLGVPGLIGVIINLLDTIGRK